MGPACTSLPRAAGLVIGCRSAGAARGHGVESGSRGDLGRGTHRGAGRRKSPATGSGPHRPETDDVDRAGMGRSASTGGNRNCGQFRIGSYLIKGLHRTDGLAPLDRSPQRLRSSLSGRSRATYCANGLGSMTGSFSLDQGGSKESAVRCCCGGVSDRPANGRSGYVRSVVVWRGPRCRSTCRRRTPRFRR